MAGGQLPGGWFIRDMSTYLPETGYCRKDPLECEFGDFITEAEWGDHLIVFDWLPGQFLHTLYDPMLQGDEENDAALEKYGELHFMTDWKGGDAGERETVYRRIDFDAFRKHMQAEYAKDGYAYENAEEEIEGLRRRIAGEPG